VNSIKKNYDRWSDQYDSDGNPTRDLDQKATIKTLSKYEFDSVLELGCGTGKNTEWLLKNASIIMGLDFSQGMLDEATGKINSDKVTFKRSDINQDWDVNNNSFSLITCSLTLEHIENLDHIFLQAFKKLKETGKFFICELHPYKQYAGSKARYKTENGIEVLEVYAHHITEYLNCAKNAGLNLLELTEWFDHHNVDEIPRLISFVFEK